MLELEFLESPDTDVLGKRVVFFDEVSMGRARSNVIIVDDPGMEPRDIRLNVLESGIFVENRESGHYLSNGKKVSGKKLHSPGDGIRVGGTSFKILSFVAGDSRQRDYDSLYQEEVQSVPHRDQLFHAIRREMDDLETS